MRQPEPGADSAGFSIVEVLLALALVMIVGLGAGQLVLGSVEVVRDSDFTTTASMLAMEKVEELRQLDYDDELLSDGDHEEGEVDGFEEFRRQWLVEEDTPSDGLKRVTVVVTAHWGSRGTPRTVTAVTYRADAIFAAGIRP